MSDQEQTVQLGPTEPANTIANTTNAEQQDSAQMALESSNSNPVAIENLMDRLNSPNTLFVFGVLLLVVLMFRMLRKNHKSNARRSNSQPSPHARIEQINTHARNSIEPSERIMVQAEDMARRLGATLDNKAARLELLIEEADRKLAILNRSIATADAPKQQPSQHSVHQPEQFTTQPSPRTIDPTLLDRARMEQDFEERQTRVAGRIDPEPTPANNKHQPVQPVTQQPVPSEPAAVQAGPQADPQELIQTQIVELAASGLSNIEIAHQLNHPIGQVELILNLRKRQG